MSVVRKRSIGQLIVAGASAVLTLGFTFRFVQYGIKWVGGAKEGDANFKALTAWALVYVVVCAGIAALAWFFPAEEESTTDKHE